MKELFVSNNDWDSHLELLYVVLENIKPRSIEEYGIGMGSSIPLAVYASTVGIPYMGFEENEEWFDRIGVHLSNCTTANLIHSKSVYDTVLGKSDFVFVDCAPAEKRKEIIERIADKAKVIVVHDTEESSDYVYGLKSVLAQFKYRLDYKPEGKPHTTAVSNFIDVSKWQL